MPTPLSPQDANDLTDALARGRLCMAELADLSPAELNALFEVAARKLEHGAIAEAVETMAALIMLFPYSAKFWRGYAVCLQRQGAWEQAVAAFRGALLLEPGHGMALCYLGEVLIQLGDDSGLESLYQAARSGDAAAVQRAGVLLRALQAEPTASAQVQPAPSALSEEDTPALFSLADGRPLPVHDSRFDAADAQYATAPRSETVTDKVFLGGSAATGEITGTDTAVLPRGPAPAKMREGSQASVTAHVDRDRERKAVRVPVVPTAWWKRKRRVPLTDDITLTDVLEEP